MPKPHETHFRIQVFIRAEGGWVSLSPSGKDAKPYEWATEEEARRKGWIFYEDRYLQGDRVRLVECCDREVMGYRRIVRVVIGRNDA